MSDGVACARRFTESNLARSNAVFNSRATFCLLNCESAEPRCMSAMAAMIAMITITTSSSTRVTPDWPLEMDLKELTISEPYEKRNDDFRRFSTPESPKT
jgi:hypothetical protein